MFAAINMLSPLVGFLARAYFARLRTRWVSDHNAWHCASSVVLGVVACFASSCWIRLLSAWYGAPLRTVASSARAFASALTRHMLRYASSRAPRICGYLASHLV